MHVKKSVQSTGEERERRLKEQFINHSREIAPSPEQGSLMEYGSAAPKGQQQPIVQHVTLPRSQHYQIRTTFKQQPDLLGKGSVPHRSNYEPKMFGLAYDSFEKKRRSPPVNPPKPERKKR